MSSDDNDTDDKDEIFEDDDGIPSFDEEEPRTPQRKPKISKLSKKKRLSNDQVQKVLDSSDEDTPVKKRCVAQTSPIHYGRNCRILSKNFVAFFHFSWLQQMSGPDFHVFTLKLRNWVFPGKKYFPKFY